MAVVADQTRDVVSEAAKKTFLNKYDFQNCFQFSVFEKRFSFGTISQHTMHIVHGTNYVESRY